MDLVKNRRTTPRARVRPRLTAVAVCAATGAVLWSSTALPIVSLAAR